MIFWQQNMIHVIEIILADGLFSKEYAALSTSYRQHCRLNIWGYVGWVDLANTEAKIQITLLILNGDPVKYIPVTLNEWEVFYCKLDFKDWLFMCTGTVISVVFPVQSKLPKIILWKNALFPWILYLGHLVTRLTSRIEKVDIHKDYQTTGNGDTYVIAGNGEWSNTIIL